MVIHFAVDHEDPGHTYFRVFVNGGLAGELVLRSTEFQDLIEALGASPRIELVRVSRPNF